MLTAVVSTRSAPVASVFKDKMIQATESPAAATAFQSIVTFKIIALPPSELNAQFLWIDYFSQRLLILN